jgi:hypothetical protein
MNQLAQQVKAERQRRDSARAAFNTRLAQVKIDLKARGIGGRIADTVSEEAYNALAEAQEVANQNRTIVLGTLAAVALWLLRHPLIAFLKRIFVGGEEEEEIES